jgi:hypothetical protein
MIDHPPTLETTLRIVAEGTDLAMKRALRMREPNLQQRARVLERLAAKWRTPNPKPRARRVLTKPEPFVLEVGDCLAYPLSKGELRNPYVSPREEERFYASYDWKKDSWGASIVLARYRRYDVFARYLVAELGTDLATRPSLADFQVASILHQRNPDGTTSRRVRAISTTRPHLRRMRVEIVGRLPIDEAGVAAEFGPGDRSAAQDNGGLAEFVDLDALSTKFVPAADPLARYLA